METGFTFRATLAELFRVRFAVREFCRHLALGSETEAWTDQLELATHEAASNIIRHACSHLPGAEIKLQFEYDESRVIVSFFHSGLFFNPSSSEIPPPEISQEGGFGRFILSKYLDEVQYQDLAPETKIIRLIKLLPQPSSSGLPKGAPTMFLETSDCEGILVVLISVHQFEAEKSAAVKKELQPLLEKFHKIVFDLREVQFLDSSGLGVFLSAFRQLNACGGEMKLSGLNRQVRSLVELVRMHRVFDIFPTVEEALAAFKR